VTRRAGGGFSGLDGGEPTVYCQRKRVGAFAFEIDDVELR